MRRYDYLIVGAGLFGSVFAQRMTELGKDCLIIEKRSHVGGNIYTREIEGIQVHEYGPHIFHTVHERVWAYVNRFAKFNHFRYEPLAVYEGRLYIQTGKVKDVSRQILANPKVEICAFNGNEWIRIAGSLVEDDRVEARASMLDAYPSLKNMYAADDGNTQVFYFKDAVATISSFTHEPETFTF